MSRDFDAMVAGHLCIDIIPSIPDTGASTLGDVLRPGKLVEVGAPAVSTGGAVSNTGIALVRLGCRVCFSARVGDDDFGRLTVDSLPEDGSTEGICRSTGTGSSYTVVLAVPNVDRVFLHDPGTNNQYCSEDLDPVLLSRCRHFHFGYPPLMRRMYENNGRELVAILRAAKGAGATTSCDMALPDPDSDAGRAPWPTILEDALPYVDIFLPSFEEALYMLDPELFKQKKRDHGDAELIDVALPSEYSATASRLLELGAGVVALKAGHRGWYCRTGEAKSLAEMAPILGESLPTWASRELWIAAWDQGKIASATGAGDCSIAGFLAAYLQGQTLEQSLRCSACLGWQNLRVLDAVSGVGSWAETTELLSRPMPIVDPELPPQDWSPLSSTDLWAGPMDGVRNG